MFDQDRLNLLITVVTLYLPQLRFHSTRSIHLLDRHSSCSSREIEKFWRKRCNFRYSIKNEIFETRGSRGRRWRAIIRCKRVIDSFHFKLRNVVRITATIHELESSTRDLSSDYIDDASYWTSAIDSTECYANPVANIRIDFGGEIYWQWAVIEIGDDFVSEGICLTPLKLGTGCVLLFYQVVIIRFFLCNLKKIFASGLN